MKIPKLAVLVLALMTMSSCGDKEIQKYAARLGILLQQYTDQLDARLDADRQLYHDLSQVFAAEAERDVYETLRTERINRSYETAADLVEERKSPAVYRSWMRETAQAEDQRARAYFAGEMAALESATAGLQKLELNAAKTKALKQALDDFAKEPGVGTSVDDLKAFNSAFQAEYSLQACKALEDNLAIVAEGLSGLENEKKNADPADVKALADKETEFKNKQTDWQNALRHSDRYDKKLAKCK